MDNYQKQLDFMDHQQAGSNNWMWTPTTTKRKVECYESWEERAFAEDAAGVLGSSGCVWPPRSYTCSFCRREFMSAQALGGHMNVHRRDRARLKQLPNTPQDQPLIIPLSSSPFLKVDPTYKKCPSQNFCTFVYDTSPSPNNSHGLLPSQEESNGAGKYKSSNSSFFVGQNRDMQVCNFSSPSSANFHHNYGKRDAKIIEVECRELENEGNNNITCANSELSISLNLVVRRNRPEESTCFKRRKIVATSPEGYPPLIFLSKSCEVEHKSKINIVPREVHGLKDCSSSSREIDLELRLGG